MSLYDYEISKRIVAQGPPFAALIMSAYRKADSDNAELLEKAFPFIVTELRDRYNAPGGLLPSDPS